MPMTILQYVFAFFMFFGTILVPVGLDLHRQTHGPLGDHIWLMAFIACFLCSHFIAFVL